MATYPAADDLPAPMAKKCADYCALKSLLAPDDFETGHDLTWSKLEKVVHEIIETRCASLADCLLKLWVILDRADEAEYETRQMLRSLHRDLRELPEPMS